MHFPILPVSTDPFGLTTARPRQSFDYPLSKTTTLQTKLAKTRLSRQKQVKFSLELFAAFSGDGSCLLICARSIRSNLLRFSFLYPQ